MHLENEHESYKRSVHFGNVYLRIKVGKLNISVKCSVLIGGANPYARSLFEDNVEETFISNNIY